jgi:hypothetical protein
MVLRLAVLRHAVADRAGWDHVHGDTGTTAGSSACIIGSQDVATAGTTLTATTRMGHPWYKMLTALVVFGHRTRDTLPPLGPPSGSPLQPLAAPTITA